MKRDNKKFLTTYPYQNLMNPWSWHLHRDSKKSRTPHKPKR